MKKNLLFFLTFVVVNCFLWAEPELYLSSSPGEHTNCTAWSRNGKYIASACDDGCIYIWDAKSGKELRKLFEELEDNKNLKAISSVSWSYDNKTLFGRSENYELFVWDILEGKQAGKLKDVFGNVCASPVDSRIAFSNGKDICIFEYTKKELNIMERNLSDLYLINSINWSSDGKYLVTANENNTVSVWDVNTKKEITIFKNHSKQPAYACFYSDGKKIVSIGEDNTVRVWDTFTSKEYFCFRIFSTGSLILNGVGQVSCSPNGKYIAVSSYEGVDEVFLLYDAMKGNLIYKKINTGYGLSSESWSPDSNYLVIGGNQSGRFVKVINVSDGTDKLYLGTTFQAVKNIALNKDETLLSVKTENSFNIFDTHTGEKLYSYDTSSVALPAWSPDGKKILSRTVNGFLQIIDISSDEIQIKDSCSGDVFCWGDKYIASGNRFSRNTEIEIFDSKTYKKIKNLSSNNNDVNSLIFTKDNKYLLCGTRDGVIVVWNMSNWTIYKTIDFNKESIYSMAISSDGMRLAVSTSHEISIWNLKTWKKENVVFSTSYGMNTLAWYNGNHLFSGGLNNLIEIWDSITGENLGGTQSLFGAVNSIVLTKDCNTLYAGCSNGAILNINLNSGLIALSMIGSKNEWLTFSKDNYFMGTEEALKNIVYFVDGLETIDIYQAYDYMYRPDLIAARLQGKEVPHLENIFSLGKEPTVSFLKPLSQSDSRDIPVTFSVQDQGGGIGSVYISLNGKVIQIADGSRKLQAVSAQDKTEVQNSEKSYVYSHTVSLSNGENVIEAWATNKAGVIESKRATMNVFWHGKTEKPSLYVLALGVNKYRDKALWLNYAVPDANAIATQFQKTAGNLYEKVNVVSLTDADVTKTGISSAIDSLSSSVQPDDVFIFYVSGHGVSKDGDYYFLPVDFRYRNDSDIPEFAVSKHFITENLSKISAQKSIIMLDTCNSGSFINAGQRGMSEKRAMIERLCRATGQAVFMASSDTQAAMEGYNGHGIFTYVVLEGLSGKADLNGDNYISVTELSHYIDEKVPYLSYEKWGYEQVPMHELYKMDFPITGK